MIKRILTFMLTVFIFSSCVLGMGAAYAAPADDAEDNVEYTAAAGLLGALEILDADRGFIKTAYVKRGDFCAYVTKLLKVTEKSSLVGYYKDVNNDTKNAAAIETLFEMNVLSKADDGRFNPNRDITMYEAIKILMTATGYQEKALTSGGVYAGYHMLAKKLDLLDGISFSGNEGLKNSEMVILLKNFLNMQMYEISGVSIEPDGEVILGMETGETILNRYYNIEYLEGVVSANQYTSLTSTDCVDEGKVMVDDMILATGGTDIFKFLGYKAEVYYDIDKETVVYYNLSERNSVVEIEASGSPQWENGKLEYYTKSGSLAEKKISTDANIIYNNRAVELFKKDYFDVKSGKVILIDSDGNSSYETVIINDYTTVIFNSINMENEIISTKNKGVSIDLSNYEYEIYDENDKRITEAYLAEWDILNILIPENSNGTVVIKRTRNQISGMIKSVSKEYIHHESGNKYRMTDGFYEEFGTIAVPGKKGLLYLDSMGEVVAFRVLDENNGLAVIINSDREKGLDGTVKLQMLLYNPEDSEEMIYAFDLRDKVKVDGESLLSSNIEAYLDKLRKEGKHLIVCYKLDEEGKILELDTLVQGAGEDPDLTLCEDYNAEVSEALTLVYQPSSRIFSGKVMMESDAVVFYVPENPASEEDYGALKLNLGNKKGFKPFTTYKVGADRMTADAIIFNNAYNSSNASFGTYDRMAYINSIYDVWDSENETEAIMIGYYQNNAYYERKVWKEEVINSVEVDDTDPENVITTVKALHEGDLVLISTNVKGEVDGYRLLYDFKKQAIPNPASEGANYNNAEYNATHRTYTGYVYEREGDAVALSARNPQELVAEAKAYLAPLYPDGNIPDSILKTEVLKSCVKFKIPTNLRKYEVGRTRGWNSCSTNDILPYTLYGDSCSKMFIHTTYSASYDAAILN